MEIKVTFSSIDGGSKTRPFKTLKGARKFATYWIGETPEVYEGSTYAVSFDGIGKITCSGISVYNLFFDPPAPEPKPVVPTTIRGIRKLEKSIDMGREHLSEIEGQHLSECAAYGDSWPGAQLQIARIKDALAEEEALLKAAFETPAGLAILAIREKRRIAYDNDPSNNPF